MKALVTGGGGFLGRRIVELLLERGDEVRFIARGSYPEVEAMGATAIQGDLRDPDIVDQAVAGVDVVFHVAALAKKWGKVEDFRSINVDATQLILDAMRRHEVPKLVFTSSPSVVAGGGSIENGSIDLPYPDHNESLYGATKAEAERLVLQANGPGLATVSLRPKLIYGPRENNMLPDIFSQAKANTLKIVGEGTNRVDLTYVDNAAWAHLDAEAALLEHLAPCAGRAYFISDDEPVSLWSWLNQLLTALGYPTINRHVSATVAQLAGSVLEWVWRTFPLSGEPRITKQIACALSNHQWFDMSPAKRDLNYRVRVPLKVGTQATIDWFKHGTAQIKTEHETLIYGAQKTTRVSHSNE